MAEEMYVTDPSLELLMGQSDIRREAAEHANTVIREGMRGDYETLMATDAVGDRLISQLDKQYHAGESRAWDIARDITGIKGAADANNVGVLAAIPVRQTQTPSVNPDAPAV